MTFDPQSLVRANSDQPFAWADSTRLSTLIDLAQPLAQGNMARPPTLVSVA